MQKETIQNKEYSKTPFFNFGLIRRLGKILLIVFDGTCEATRYA